MHTSLPSPTRSPRRRRLALGLGLAGLALALGAAAPWWLATTSEPRRVGTSCAEAPVSGPGSPADVRAGVCATLAALVAAWDRGDAAGYGARFTDDASYVAFTGTVYEGRTDIVTGHAALFAGLLSGTRLEVRHLGIDLVAPGVARVLTRGDTYEGDTPPAAPTKVQTYLMVERDGAWQVAAFHNTQRAQVMEGVQFLLEPASRPVLERR